MRRLLLAVACVVGLAGCGGGVSSHHATQKLTPGPTACPGYVTAYGCSAHSPTFGLPPLGLALAPRSAVPTVALYDSVTVSVLPHGSPAVAGYLSGSWPTWFSLRAAFPTAIRIPVAIRALPVYPSLVGRMACLDVEPGDATPPEAGPWARGELGLGVKPCLYSALKNGMGATQASLAHWLGSGWRAKVFLWDADWTGSSHLDSGFDATQYTDHYQNLNVDGSVATRAFLGLKPPAPPPPICLTHRMSRSACRAAKAKIASALRAESSSNSAYLARGCPVLASRERYFSARLKSQPRVRAAYRRGALAATTRVERKRQCGLFRRRAAYFGNRVGALRLAN